jgi:hypothetical protein
MNEKKIKIAVDVDPDFADSITVQNLKEFYESMLNDTDDESIELRMHVKYTLRAFMIHDEFEEYMDKIFKDEEQLKELDRKAFIREYSKKLKTFKEEDSDD